MRMVWTVAVAALLLLAVEAHADTVYLKNGQTVWGTEVLEEGDTVFVVRPGEKLRFPKGDVSRIERSRASIPRYYEPPTGGAAQGGEAPGSTRPVGSASAPVPEGPASSQATKAPETVAPPTGAPPAPLTPTRLPPPPPPGENKAQ
jgi:hypothetical protein